MHTTDQFLAITTQFGFNRLVKNEQVVLEFLKSVLPINILKIDRSHVSQEPIENPQTSARKRQVTQESMLGEEEPRSSSAHGAETSFKTEYTCSTMEGNRINVILQLSKEKDFLHRSFYFYYSCSMIASNQKSHSLKTMKLLPTYHIVLQFPLHHSTATLTSKVNDGIPSSCECWMSWYTFSKMKNRSCPSCPASGAEQSVGSESSLLNLCVLSIPEFMNLNKTRPPSSVLEKLIWLFANLGKQSQEILPKWALQEQFKQVLLLLKRSELLLFELKQYEKEAALLREEQENLALARKEGMEVGHLRAMQDGIVSMYNILQANMKVEEAYDLIVVAHHPDIVFSVLGPRPSP